MTSDIKALNTSDFVEHLSSNRENEEAPSYEYAHTERRRRSPNFRACQNTFCSLWCRLVESFRDRISFPTIFRVLGFQATRREGVGMKIKIRSRKEWILSRIYVRAITIPHLKSRRDFHAKLFFGKGKNLKNTERGKKRCDLDSEVKRRVNTFMHPNTRSSNSRLVFVLPFSFSLRFLFLFFLKKCNALFRRIA